jgi:hypothetical protein
MTDDELDTLSIIRDRVHLLAELTTAVISIQGATLHGMAQLLSDTVSDLNRIIGYEQES